MYYFDVNEFAREYFMEANAHWMAQKIDEVEKTLDILTVVIKEMNAAGSIPLTHLNNQTHWKTDPKEDPQPNLTPPEDNIYQSPDNEQEKIFNIALEPQRIRTFNIKYVMPNAEKEASYAVKSIANAFKTT